MTLNVLLVAYPFAPVGPAAIGGAEQVLSELDHGLIEAGHRCSVIACNGSSVRGAFISCGPQSEWLDATQQSYMRARVRRLIEHVLRSEAFDLVHFHGVDFHHYLPRTQRPLLATLHLPARLYSREIFAESSDSLFLHCVSRSQHRTCPNSGRLLPPIANGVRLDHFIPRYEKQDYLLAMGRICPEKGYHLALEAAHAAGVPLLLAGRVFPYPEHLKYFEERLVPLLDDRRRFIGPVGPAERARLLADARCLVIPSLIEETSSLVAMEALASATPVIATGQGALPEVIANGRTGILVNDLAEMVAAIRLVDAIDPRTCRQEAESRFSARDTFKRYVSLYQHLVGSIANVG